MFHNHHDHTDGSVRSRNSNEGDDGVLVDPPVDAHPSYRGVDDLANMFFINSAPLAYMNEIPRPPEDAPPSETASPEPSLSIHADDLSDSVLETSLIEDFLNNDNSSQQSILSAGSACGSARVSLSPVNREAREPNDYYGALGRSLAESGNLAEDPPSSPRYTDESRQRVVVETVDNDTESICSEADDDGSVEGGTAEDNNNGTSRCYTHLLILGVLMFLAIASLCFYSSVEIERLPPARPATPLYVKPHQQQTQDAIIYPAPTPAVFHPPTEQPIVAVIPRVEETLKIPEPSSFFAATEPSTSNYESPVSFSRALFFVLGSIWSELRWCYNTFGLSTTIVAIVVTLSSTLLFLRRGYPQKEGEGNSNKCCKFEYRTESSNDSSTAARASAAKPKADLSIVLRGSDFTEYHALFRFMANFQNVKESTRRGKLSGDLEALCNKFKYAETYCKLSSSELKSIIDCFGNKYERNSSKSKLVQTVISAYQNRLTAMTKNEIIGILAVHNVSFKSSSKKGELVRLALEAGF